MRVGKTRYVMKSVKIQCPAKINLDLKVINKREDGFHNIESVMQTINLYDYISISMIDSDKNEIKLSGNSAEIPYDETNLVFKAAKLFLEEKPTTPKKLIIDIEKNIPVSAGLAGGSTNAAGVIFGLNKLMNDLLPEVELHNLCAKLGSDLNVCLTGGCLKTSGRGEVVKPHLYNQYDVNLIKPLDLGISAKYAYTRFSEKLSGGVGVESRRNFVNDLEWAILNDFNQLQYVKNKYPSAIMTGSGSTYFSLEEKFTQEAGFWVENGLKTITEGVKIV